MEGDVEIFKDLSLAERSFYAVPWRWVLESLSEVEESRPYGEYIKIEHLNILNMFRRECEQH
jgi:hypothetical protein